MGSEINIFRTVLILLYFCCDAPFLSFHQNPSDSSHLVVFRYLAMKCKVNITIEIGIFDTIIGIKYSRVNMTEIFDSYRLTFASISQSIFVAIVGTA